MTNNMKSGLILVWEDADYAPVCGFPNLFLRYSLIAFQTSFRRNDAHKMSNMHLKKQSSLLRVMWSQ